MLSVFLCLQVRQALRRQQEEGGNSQQHSVSDRSATAELLRIKDHLIDVEKNVRFNKTPQLTLVLFICSNFPEFLWYFCRTLPSTRRAVY